jgi:hypothetical protein
MTMLRKIVLMTVMGMMLLGTLTACGARRDRDNVAPAPAVQTSAPVSAPASEALSAQAEQELDALIAALETEAAPDELREFVP